MSGHVRTDFKTEEHLSELNEIPLSYALQGQTKPNMPGKVNCRLVSIEILANLAKIDVRDWLLVLHRCAVAFSFVFFQNRVEHIGRLFELGIGEYVELSLILLQLSLYSRTEAIIPWLLITLAVFAFHGRIALAETVVELFSRAFL